jgi:hypothetical protein
MASKGCAYTFNLKGGWYKLMTKIAGRRIVAVIAVLVLLGLVRTGVAEVVDRIVAEVNDEIITMSELQNMAKAIQTQSGFPGRLIARCSGRCWRR